VFDEWQAREWTRSCGTNDCGVRVSPKENFQCINKAKKKGSTGKTGVYAAKYYGLTSKRKRGSGGNRHLADVSPEGPGA